MKENDREDARRRFFQDTQNHTMEILNDNGLYRHLTFSNNGSCVYKFHLTTWPMYLCISGDMGCFVFSRLRDMFEFFRHGMGEELTINPGYWGGKLQAADKSGYQEFDKEYCKQRIIDAIRESGEKGRAKILREVKDEIFHVIENEGEEAAASAICHFESESGFIFQGFWDWGPFRKYTFHFLWCLWAIAWGIRQYDLTRGV